MLKTQLPQLEEQKIIWPRLGSMPWRAGIRSALFAANAAIFRDLYPLAVAAPETIGSIGDFAIPAPLAAPNKVMFVRTYLPDE
jgi:hypothetical protein